jgi:3-dehydroquinate synthase
VISLRKIGANRQTALLALGGGIVQDVAAFIASVYMRGLKWRYYPTTLLAMVDSCIGGKSSINVGPYKNLVGTYHPPDTVLIDPSLALSLSDERRVGGLVEAAKICFCRNQETFQEYLSFKPAPAMSVEQVERVAKCSLLAKKWFIEVDEFDKAERLLLNFGHTFGHAIEGASHFEIEHGVGVGLGILCAIEMGRLLGRDYGYLRHVNTLREHLKELLVAVPGLRRRVSKLSLEDVLDRFQADKKHGIAFYTVILIADNGTVELFRLTKSQQSLDLVRIAVESIMSDLSFQS